MDTIENLAFHQNGDLKFLFTVAIISITVWFNHKNFLYWLHLGKKFVAFTFLVGSRKMCWRKQLSSSF